MAIYTTPGSYINESKLVSLVPTVNGPTSAVFFGEAARGPLVPTLINDWPTYKSLFGDLDASYELGYAVYHYFANGGRSTYVTRVIGAGAAKATVVGVPFYPTGTGNASASLFTVSSTSAGTWGNGLTVVTNNGNVSASTTVKPSFNLSVQLNGVEVEKWTELSTDSNANRYFMEVINRYSTFISASAPHAFTGSTVSASAGVVFSGPSDTRTATLAGGTSVSVANSDYTTSFDGVDAIRGNLLLNAVGITNLSVVQSLITKAVTRGDSFVIIDPKKSDATATDIATTSSSFAGLGAYAAIYAPCLEMVDPAKTGSAAIRTTYPGGAVAGMYVRMELERTVAKAPAGYSADIRGALGLTVKLTDAQVGTLYDATPPTNTFKAIAGAGVIANGTRTLEKTSPDKFIPVRRNLNFIKNSLKKITDPEVFEPNDANTWNRIDNNISSFLANHWRAGGLKGSRSSDAFFVICDATNNTASSIDQGIINVSVGVALSYPAEFIVINLSQWTGGSNTTETTL